jgi:hypothetical protein
MSPAKRRGAMKILPLLLASLMVLSATTSFAGSWSKSVDANLTLTQNAYSDNWVGGEAGAISWTFNVNALAEKQLNPKLHNKNTLKLSFGQTHNQDVETDDWQKPVKSTDLIDFETVLRFTLGAFVDPYTAGRAESQFYDASDPEKSRLMNPLRLTESIGAAKVFIKEEKRDLTSRLGFAFRQHINRDMLDPATDERSTETTNDGGIELVTDFKTPLAKDRITFTSKLSIFKALFYSESDELEGLPNEDYWKSPDVNWENIFAASITEYIMVNLYVQWLYDKEIDKVGRFKQTLALGLTYKLI